MGRHAFQEVSGYERSRVATLATLALAAMALLIGAPDLPVWLGVGCIVASERSYRRAAYGLLGGTTENRISAVTMRSGGHLVLLLVVACFSLGAIVIATLP